MRGARIVPLLVVIMTAAACGSGAVADRTDIGRVETTWSTVASSRTETLRALAVPVAGCVARHDTDHPAFHGCVDWHSAVHGALALYAVSRLTGDPTYRAAAVAASGDPAALRAEEDALRGGDLGVEVPYGLAWLLQLDAEAARVGDDRFRGLATVAAGILVAHLDGLDAAALRRSVLARDYDNASWAAVALASWGRDSPAAVAAAASVAERSTGLVGAACDDRALRDRAEFFDPCALLLLLAAATGRDAPDRADAVERLTRAATAAGVSSTAHGAGLPYSRAWGLIAAWRLTGDRAALDAAARVITEQNAHEERWNGPYRTVGHWVAQFGVFAYTLGPDR